MYCIFSVLVTCILTYRQKLFGKERVKQWETGCKTNFIRLWVSACQRMCLWFYFCRVKPRWTFHTWGSWIGMLGVSLVTSSSVCVYICILTYLQGSPLRYEKGWLPFQSRVRSYFKCIWVFWKHPLLFCSYFYFIEEKPKRSLQSILAFNLSQKNWHCSSLNL